MTGLDMIVAFLSVIALTILVMWGFVASSPEYRANTKERVICGLAWLSFFVLQYWYWSYI